MLVLVGAWRVRVRVRAALIVLLILWTLPLAAAVKQGGHDVLHYTQCCRVSLLFCVCRQTHVLRAGATGTHWQLLAAAACWGVHNTPMQPCACWRRLPPSGGVCCVHVQSGDGGIAGGGRQAGRCARWQDASSLYSLQSRTVCALAGSAGCCFSAVATRHRMVLIARCPVWQSP